MDEIADKSLESQVVSRAYRMGVQVRGNSGVIIEKLVAKDSIEEVMESISSGKLNDLAYDQSKSESTKSRQQAKLHYLLKQLNFIRPSVANQYRSFKRKAAACGGEIVSNKAPLTQKVRFK